MPGVREKTEESVICPFCKKPTNVPISHMMILHFEMRIKYEKLANGKWNLPMGCPGCEMRINSVDEIIHYRTCQKLHLWLAQQKILQVAE